MKKMLLLASALLVSACASLAPESVSSPRPLPKAVTTAPSASIETYWSESLQRLQNETLDDLRESLERARISQPRTAPAAPLR